MANGQWPVVYLFVFQMKLIVTSLMDGFLRGFLKTIMHLGKSVDASSTSPVCTTPGIRKVASSVPVAFLYNLQPRSVTSSSLES